MWKQDRAPRRTDLSPGPNPDCPAEAQALGGRNDVVRIREAVRP
jgi:hypothetical protein